MKIYEEYITNLSQNKLKLVSCISIYHGKSVIIEHRVVAGRKDLGAIDYQHDASFSPCHARDMCNWH